METNTKGNPHPNEGLHALVAASGNAALIQRLDTLIAEALGREQLGFFLYGALNTLIGECKRAPTLLNGVQEQLERMSEFIRDTFPELKTKPTAENAAGEDAASQVKHDPSPPPSIFDGIEVPTTLPVGPKQSEKVAEIDTLALAFRMAIRNESEQQRVLGLYASMQGVREDDPLRNSKVNRLRMLVSHTQIFELLTRCLLRIPAEQRENWFIDLVKEKAIWPMMHMTAKEFLTEKIVPTLTWQNALQGKATPLMVTNDRNAKRQASAGPAKRDGNEVLLETPAQLGSTTADQLNVHGAFELFMARGTKQYDEVSNRLAQKKKGDRRLLTGLRRKAAADRRVKLFAEVLLRTEPKDRLALLQQMSGKLKDGNPKGLLKRIVTSNLWRKAHAPAVQ